MSYLTNEDLVQILSGGRLPILRATTKHLSVFNPMSIESGIRDWSGRKVPGLPVGYGGRDGSAGVFYYDPFLLHAAKRRLRNGHAIEPIIPNRNGIVLGDVGMWKSGLVKDLVYMACAAGYPVLVTDLKGEYILLAGTIEGARILSFRKGDASTKLVINPLDPNIPEEVQVDLLISLTLTTMDRTRVSLDIEESSLLESAIKAAKAENRAADGKPIRVTVLADVVKKLFEPSEDMESSMYATRDYLQQKGRPMALGLRQLTEGRLKGLVDGETSKDFFQTPPLLVLNLRGLQDDALAIMVIVLNFLYSSLGSFRWIFHDETWRLAAFPGFVMSLRTAFKLGRSERVSNWIIFHHLRDLWRSSQQEIVEGLFADAATRVLYHQDRSELMLAAEALNLNSAVLDRVPGLPAGTAIWMVGEDVIEVRHETTPEVRPFVETGNLDEVLAALGY